MSIFKPNKAIESEINQEVERRDLSSAQNTQSAMLNPDLSSESDSNQVAIRGTVNETTGGGGSGNASATPAVTQNDQPSQSDLSRVVSTGEAEEQETGNRQPTNSKGVVETNRDALARQILERRLDINDKARENKAYQAGAGYDEAIAVLEDWQKRHPQETEEERKKRERKERSKRIISAVSDGLSALGNLYFTSQYAPNAYTGENSQLKATNAVIDKIKAEREKDADQYLNFSLKIGDLKNQKAKTLADLEAQRERQRLAREAGDRDKRRLEIEEVNAPYKQREAKGKAEKAEHDAATAKARADAAPETQRLRQETERAKARKYGADAGASHARAKSYSKTVHHFRGKEYESLKDYTKDVTEAARAYNERHKNDKGFKPIEFEREERSAYGIKKVARHPEDYAGEVERLLEEEENDKVAPSQKKKTSQQSGKRAPYIK